MTQAQIVSNPFALMMEPEAVFAAIERSERLARLQSRICRPLDRVTAVKDDDWNDAGDLELTSDAIGPLDE